MTRIKVISVTTIAVIGALASLLIQHRSQTSLRTGAARLQEQSNQLAALTAERDRLSHPASQGDGERTEDHTVELARLRKEAEALKKRTNDLGRQLALSHDSRAARAAAATASHPMTIEERMHLVKSALPVATAFCAYANDHRNQSALNLDQLAPYLTKLNVSLPGNDQFEIIYQGSLDRVQGIPPGSVAVVRSVQTWPGQDGKMIRVYGMMDGHTINVGSDDNFQSWEAQHVIMPPTTDPSDQ
jgi:hypothetical protein